MSGIRCSFPFFKGLTPHAVSCAALCSFVVLGAPLHAQTTGTILGQVADPSGAAIVDAQVEAENIGTGLVRETSTNETGFYIFNALPTGLYRVTVFFRRILDIRPIGGRGERRAEQPRGC